MTDSRKYGKLKNLIGQIAKGYVDSQKFTGIFQARLVSVNPLTFVKSNDIEISGNSLIVPKYRVFTEQDIGNYFVFMNNHGGQTFYYLYEASSPGENGIPYTFIGRIEGIERDITHLRRKGD